MAPLEGQHPGRCCCLESRKGLAFLVMSTSRYARYVPAQAHQAWQGRDVPWLWLRCLEIVLLEHRWGKEVGEGGERWKWRCAPKSHTPLMTTALWGQAERVAAGVSSCSAPWGIYLANEQVSWLHCLCTAKICFAKPEGDFQHKERTTNAPRNRTQGHCWLCLYYSLIDQSVSHHDQSLQQLLP